MAKLIDEVYHAIEPLVTKYQQIYVETIQKIEELYTKQVWMTQI